MSVLRVRELHARKILAALAVLQLAAALPGLGTLAAQEPPDYAIRQLSPSGEPASRVSGSVGGRSARGVGGVRRRRRERRRGRGLRHAEKRFRSASTFAAGRLRRDRPARLLARRPPSALPRRSGGRWSGGDLERRAVGIGSRGGQAQRRSHRRRRPLLPRPGGGRPVGLRGRHGIRQGGLERAVHRSEPARRAPRSARGGRRDAAERLLPAGRRAPPHPVPRHRRDFRPGLHRSDRGPAGRGDPPRRRDSGRLRPARRRLHCRFDAPALRRLLSTRLGVYPALERAGDRARRRRRLARRELRLRRSDSGTGHLSRQPTCGLQRRPAGGRAQRPVERSGRGAGGGDRAAQPVAGHERRRQEQLQDLARFDAGRLHRRSGLRRALLSLLGADRGTFDRGGIALSGRAHGRQRTRRNWRSRRTARGSSSASTSP